ncbi:MAG: carotenoid biosynthesis protein [Crocinitomicaceae bacterium]|nr:carotenoid biosynthesis protein [Crocinitomicaceae bacterium]
MIQAAALSEQVSRYKQVLLIGLLIIFYTVGVVGLSIEEYRSNFLSLSFFNLALSFVLLLMGRNLQSLRLYVFIFFAFVVGVGVELIGVHTGYLFGDYAYGQSLGVKFYDVPIIIGINWGVLVIISASVAQRFQMNKYLQAVVASLFMLLLDVLIEPVAVESDYWTWEGDVIPLFNFVCWFGVALLLQFVYFGLNLAEKNKVATALYCIQFMFFLILNIV